MPRPQTNLATLFAFMTLLAISMAGVTNAIPYNGKTSVPIFVIVGFWVGVVCFGSALGLAISGVAWRKPWLGALVGGPLGLVALCFVMPMVASVFRWFHKLPGQTQLTLVAVVAFVCGWFGHRLWAVITKHFHQARYNIK